MRGDISSALQGLEYSNKTIVHYYIVWGERVIHRKLHRTSAMHRVPTVSLWGRHSLNRTFLLARGMPLAHGARSQTKSNKHQAQPCRQRMLSALHSFSFFSSVCVRRSLALSSSLPSSLPHLFRRRRNERRHAPAHTPTHPPTHTSPPPHCVPSTRVVRNFGRPSLPPPSPPSAANAAERSRGTLLVRLSTMAPIHPPHPPTAPPWTCCALSVGGHWCIRVCLACVVSPPSFLTLPPHAAPRPACGVRQWECSAAGSSPGLLASLAPPTHSPPPFHSLPPTCTGAR